MDLESKTLSKTYITEECLFGSSLQIQPQALKEKLELILQTLYQEMQNYSTRFQQEKNRLLESLKQKDDIIERLAMANSQLAVKNQQLQKAKLRQSIQYKAKLFQTQSEYQKEKEHLFSVIKYLETKNQQMIQKIKKLERNATQKNLKLRMPHSAKYIIVDDISSQYSRETPISSKNILKQTRTNPSQFFHKRLDSKISKLSKVSSAKHLTSMFDAEYSDCKKEQFHDLSPIKKNNQEIVLQYDKRNGLSKSSVRFFMGNDINKQTRKLKDL